MNRRDVLAASLGSGLATFILSAGYAATRDDGEARLTVLMQYMSEAGWRDSPQSATLQGVDVGTNAMLRHRLNDRSAAAMLRELGRTRTMIAGFEAVDPSSLLAISVIYRYVALFKLKARAVGPDNFGVGNAQYPFIITQRDGAYLAIPDFLNASHKIGNSQDAEAYLDRVRAFATVLDQDSERQATEAQRGYLAPGFVLDTALAQMAALRLPTAEANSITRSIVRRATGAIPGDWGVRCAAIVEREVYPALDRQIARVLRLRADARTSAGVWDVPDGEALYAAALEDATTTKTDAAELHRLGFASVAEIAGELESLLAKQNLTRGSVGDRLVELSRRPDLLYANTAAGRDELLRDASVMLDAMRPRLSAFFDSPPDDPLRIDPAAAEVADGASDGNYFPASSDGSIPARLRINVKALAGTPRYAMPAFAYHEGLPGHHLQYGYAGRGNRWRFSAYAEGWALYAEQLADEMGAYRTPLERIGYLQSRLFRAARLVVDTGIHVRRWSREKAAAYLVSETGYSPAASQREVDRYCVNPGQACSYMVGYLAWTRGREAARHMLGANYDVKNFHKVLRFGAVPLAILERLIKHPPLD